MVKTLENNTQLHGISSEGFLIQLYIIVHSVDKTDKNM